MRSPALLLGGAAFALAVLGGALSGVASLVGFGLAAVHGALALRFAEGNPRRKPRGAIAAGVATLGFAAVLLLSGAVGLGLVAAFVGAVVAFAGTQLSLLQSELPPGLELPAPLSLRTNLGVAADEAMKLTWSVIDRFQPDPVHTRVAQDLREATERYREEGVFADPSRAHPRPPALEKVELTRSVVRGVGPVEHLTFESDYTAAEPEIRHAYAAHPGTRRALVHLLRHGDRPRPTLVCVHGYGMGRLAFDARQWDLDGWRQLGLDLALPILPLHGPRSTGRRSGAGFLDGHPLQTNAAFAQTIWELRRLVGWLRQQGAPAVGVTGLSLGGYTTALLASLEPGLASAVPQIPAVSIDELLDADLRDEDRRERERSGLTEALRRSAFAPHAPLAGRRAVRKEACLIVAARADRICPPVQAHALWEHWERPALHWTPGSHLVPWDREATRERVREHLRETLLAASRPEGQPGLSRFAWSEAVPAGSSSEGQPS